MTTRVNTAHSSIHTRHARDTTLTSTIHHNRPRCQHGRQLRRHTRHRARGRNINQSCRRPRLLDRATFRVTLQEPGRGPEEPDARSPKQWQSTTPSHANTPNAQPAPRQTQPRRCEAGVHAFTEERDAKPAFPAKRSWRRKGKLNEPWCSRHTSWIPL